MVKRGDWYDYESKYEEGGMELLVPARAPDDVLEEVRRLAVEVFHIVGCSGMARVDFFVEDGDVLVNELNTIPGFTSERVRQAVRSERCLLSRAARPARGARARALRGGASLPVLSCTPARPAAGCSHFLRLSSRIVASPLSGSSVIHMR